MGMITDQDVEKLKGTFATKEDLGALEERLTEKFVTKVEHRELVVRVDGIQEQLGDLKVEVGELHDKFDSLSGKLEVMDTKFDAMLDLLTGNMQENVMGAAHFARHDRQIGALATHAGVSLPD